MFHIHTHAHVRVKNGESNNNKKMSQKLNVRTCGVQKKNPRSLCCLFRVYTRQTKKKLATNATPAITRTEGFWGFVFLFFVECATYALSESVFGGDCHSHTHTRIHSQLSYPIYIYIYMLCVVGIFEAHKNTVRRTHTALLLSEKRFRHKKNKLCYENVFFVVFLLFFVLFYRYSLLLNVYDFVGIMRTRGECGRPYT